MSAYCCPNCQEQALKMLPDCGHYECGMCFTVWHIVAVVHKPGRVMFTLDDIASNPELIDTILDKAHTRALKMTGGAV